MTNQYSNNKCMLLYLKDFQAISKLNDTQIGILIRACFNYHIKRELPKFDDDFLSVVFEFLKNDFDYNIEKYNNVCQRNRNNGFKGGRPKKAENPKNPNGLEQNPNNPNGFEENPNKPKKPKDKNKDKNKDKDKDKNKDKIIDIFKNEYKKIYDTPIILSKNQIKTIKELSKQIENFTETIPNVLAKFDLIEWEFENGKQKATLSWLLKENHYIDVLNGNYNSYLKNIVNFDDKQQSEIQNKYPRKD